MRECQTLAIWELRPINSLAGLADSTYPYALCENYIYFSVLWRSSCFCRPRWSSRNSGHRLRRAEARPRHRQMRPTGRQPAATIQEAMPIWRQPDHGRERWNDGRHRLLALIDAGLIISGASVLMVRLTPTSARRLETVAIDANDGRCRGIAAPGFDEVAAAAGAPAGGRGLVVKQMRTRLPW